MRRQLLAGIVYAVVVLFTCTTAAYAEGRIVGDFGEQIYKPSRAVVTPHIPWAVPYAGGKLRVLFMGWHQEMREVIEFAQRLDMEYEFFATAGKSGEGVLAPNHLRQGHYLGDEPGDKLRRLKRLLEGPDYDLIVMGDLDWTSFPLFARYEILKKVKRGTGLIRLGSGRHGRKRDEYLERASKEGIDVPPSVVGGVPWQALRVFRKHADVQGFLKSTLAASRFGEGRIVELAGYQVPKLQLICPGFTEIPLGGANWVSWWGCRSDEYKAARPEYDMPMDEIKLLDYDYYLAWLIKVMLFAAQKEPGVTVWGEDESPGMVREMPREGLDEITFAVALSVPRDLSSLTADFALRDRDNNVLAESRETNVKLQRGDNTVSFPVRNIPAGDYFADLWIRRDGAVLGFGSQALRVASKARIRAVKLASDHYKKDEAITGVIDVHGYGRGDAVPSRRVRGRAEGSPSPAVPADVRVDAGPSDSGDSALTLRISQKDSFGRLVRESSFTIDHSPCPYLRPPPRSPSGNT